ncbi:flap endonuclease GEN homolog 1 isoform X2 [Electrophorus electricus]|uniref:flap endonuclease GEN homolog 1 isoform X2 n=1 Tax=Electrophorus electricus TaxID=8005 RepID=UPI0015D066FF|nr:flap endonuclease GEN homolog 1 isoform X2 [Electrophorus electricus]
MGVTELWSVLSPVQETVSLYSLAGKTLAVDLSLWVCEAQHVQAMMGKVTKPHLRNLFFRASSLLRMGVKLVFVMEGEAPKIKAETMSKRTEMGFRGVKTKGAPKHAVLKSTSRGRFKAVLRECAEMLDCLGVPWVQAAGEAEALCAFLDSQGFVDGCITNDGDAFLYGAQTVYRNFNMNTKDPQIDCYRMSRVTEELQLERETLVGVALLLGCDYLPKGVAGVGKEQTLKLIKNLQGQTLLQKFNEWKRSTSETLQLPGKKVSHCLVCHHPGSAKSHERNGCVFCDSKRFCQPQDYDSQCPCDWHRSEHARQASAVEANIKKKTLACDKFPFTEDKPIYSFRRRKPNLLLMQNFALDKLEWPKHYTSKKVLELLTYVELVNRRHGTEMPTQIEPLRIYKRRIRNGLSCFEVIWRKPDHYVFPEDCPPDDPDVVRTVEEENLFSVSYPHLVQLFHKEISEAKDSRSKQKKVTVEKVKSTESPDGFSDLFARMSLQTSSGLHLPASLETNQNILTALRTVAPTIPPHDAPKSLKRSSEGSETQAAADAPPTPQDCQRGLPSSPCPTGTAPQAQSSPSVSTVINQLHLSSIDWEALSFTASPCSQPQCSKADLGSVNNVDKGARTSDCSSSTAVKSDCGELTVLQAEGLSECPLRERVLKRNMGKSEDLLNSGEHLTRIILHTSQSEDTDSGRSLKPKSCQPVTKRHILPLQQHRQSGPSRPGARVLKDTTATTNTQKPKECSLDRVPPKSRFVKLKHSLPSSVLPQRSYSDPGHDRRFSDMEHTNQQRTCKKTVCTSQGSSSEDSDVENHNRTDHRKNTFKSKARSKLQHAGKTALPHLTQNRSSVVFMKLNPVRTKQRSDTTKSSSQPLGVVFSGTPPQIQTSSRRSEGSDCSVDSPRPLVERLKLKPK